MFIKICGLSEPESIAAAVASGADAIGFVFADSPRRVTPAQALALSRDLPEEVLRIAVMRHPSPREWDQVWEEFRPDCLQTDAADFAGLDMVGRCDKLPVWRDRVLAASPAAALPRRFLFEGMASGSGARPDWSQAQKLAAGHEVVLAGGLTAGNLAEAIATVKPFGVDVSSGVESAPGKKSAEKIKEFIALARANGGSGATTNA